MKKFDELTQVELAQLTEEQIGTYIEFAMMERGIVPVECPVKPTLESAGITKSEVAYRVGANLYIDRDEATKAAKFKMASTNYDYSGAGYDYKWLTTDEIEKSVVEEYYYKEDDVKRMASVLRSIREKTEAYERIYKEYKEVTKKSANIKQEITNAIWEAQDYLDRVKHAQKTFDKYKELCMGGEEAAKNFFRLNFSPDMIREILGETIVADSENGVEVSDDN
jgi:molecular chaperone DnaK (HSP70)